MTLPEFSLNGRIALVTGGERGLGLEIAIGRSGSPLQLDITDEAAVQKAFSEIQEKY